MVEKVIFSQNNLGYKPSQNLKQWRYLRNSKAGILFWPLSTFAFYLTMLSMQHEGRGKAAKVDENLAKWAKIWRSTVFSAFVLMRLFHTTCVHLRPQRTVRICIEFKRSSISKFPQFSKTHHKTSFKMYQFWKYLFDKEKIMKGIIP